MLERRYIVFAGAGLLLLICLMLFRSWTQSHPAITITTDSSPVIMEINGSSFNLNSTHKTLRWAKNIYNYKATYMSNGDTINLYGSVDTATDSGAKIMLNYKVFTRQSIKEALCRADGVNTYHCGESYTPRNVKFVSDHEWAIITVEPSDELGSSLDILQLQNGSWKKVAGPSDPADLQGLVPDFVIRAVGQ
jgi:hypothetical protein